MPRQRTERNKPEARPPDPRFTICTYSWLRRSGLESRVAEVSDAAQAGMCLDQTMQFPEGFLWGAATSAYQIEGGRHEGGKGESIWDRFSDLGRIPESGDIACDHFNRVAEDVALMADLGIDAYRFSIAWTRVLPDGTGKVSQEGLDFYRRLVELLGEAGITPFATLYHWDLPQALEDRGGWTDRATVDAFVEYANVATTALGDGVKHWTTHNEPWVAAYLGHLEGVFAPGRRSWPEALSAAHHLLLSHGRAVPVIKANVTDGEAGIVLDCRHSYPASGTSEDADANRHFDGFRNRWFFDPVFGKGYPSDIWNRFSELGRIPEHLVRDTDMDEIATPTDFLGLNFYTSIAVSAGHEESEDTGVPSGPNPPAGYTEMGWPITPEALTDFLVRIDRDYGPSAIYITENGASFGDGPDETGVIDDQRRIDYLDSHFAAAAAAIAEGVPLRGYFVWSLMDNLEWASGFSQRFGLIWVDHDSGERIPKRSYDWYRDFIRQRTA